MVKLTMLTGEEMEYTISMGALRRIKERYPEYTAKYFAAVGGEKVETSEDAFWRSADILYTGYLCMMVKADKLDEALSYEDYLDILPEDMNLIVLASAALINPNQAGAFEKYSKSIQKSSRTR